MFCQLGSARCRGVYHNLYRYYCREEHAVYLKSIHATVIPVSYTVGEHLKHLYLLSNVVKQSPLNRGISVMHSVASHFNT